MVATHKDNTDSKRLQWIQDMQEDISAEDWGMICSRAQMQEDISSEDWGMICSRAQIQTINTRLRLLQYSWIMRTYINHPC
jgi:hypothetical protein